MIIPEEHIIRTQYDPATGLCWYTVDYRGQHYTFSIPLAKLEAHGALPGSYHARRNHLMAECAKAVKGPPDAEKFVPNVLRREEPPAASPAEQKGEAAAPGVASTDPAVAS